MGASFIDYIIADSTVIPEDTYSCYSEKIINIPYTFQANSSRPALTGQSISRKDYGIDEDAFVYCCFNNSYKFNPHLFDLWGTILNSNNNCCILFISDSKVVEDNIKKEFLRRNVGLEKIIFLNRAPYETYLSYYGLADLFLDTTPFNAGTTASDSLWCGVPVLTNAGLSFTGRMAASLLNSVNLLELIAFSDADYVKKAIELARSPKYLCDLRKILENNLQQSSLFKPNEFVKNLETIFQKIYLEI
jgi:predicted O-linked N-acetylglucosamine transferase (SPINDLY family)